MAKDDIVKYAIQDTIVRLKESGYDFKGVYSYDDNGNIIAVTINLKGRLV